MPIELWTLICFSAGFITGIILFVGIPWLIERLTLL